ncbi:hypothetical protein KS882_004492 [Vibrio parahaemolyticus]|nr:hypothetical protein [Vibrio parahaemolyticus]
MNYFEKEKKKIEQGKFELMRRRLNWSLVLKPLLLDYCQNIAKDENDKGFPYRLFCYQASKDVNAETVQFGMGLNYTGIEKKDVEYTVDGVERSSEKYYEKQCALVFSQSPDGLVMVLLYPYKSERHKRNEDYIILYNRLLPEDITRALINKILKNFAFYARISSLNGMAAGYSIDDRVKLFKMKFFDIRNRIARQNAVMNLNSEWLKMLVTALVTFVITILVQKFGM